MIHTRLLYRLAVFFSRVNAFFSRTNHLHTARFASLHERAHLLHPTIEKLGTSLLLGRSSYNRVAPGSRGHGQVRGFFTQTELKPIL